MYVFAQALIYNWQTLKRQVTTLHKTVGDIAEIQVIMRSFNCLNLIFDKINYK